MMTSEKKSMIISGGVLVFVLIIGYVIILFA